MSATVPAAHAHEGTGGCAPCHVSTLHPCEGDGGEEEKGYSASSGADAAVEPLDPLRCFSAFDVLRGALATCTCAPALSRSTEKGAGSPSLLPGAPLPSAWRTEQTREALGTLVDLVAADVGISSARHGQDEAPKDVESARSRLSVDALLLHLTAEGPSLRAALRRRRRQLLPMPPRDDATTHSEPEACDEARAACEEDEALTVLIRCAASVALANRNLGSNARKDRKEVQTPASRVLQTCTALSLLRTSSLFHQPLRAGTEHTAASRSTIAAADASAYWCSTGCMGLDQALGGGGFRSGWVTEVYGEAGAGKTQLGLQCLLQQAATDVCHAAVALALASNADLTSLAHMATAAGMCGSSSPAVKCMEVFDRDAVEAARCAVVYLVSEDVPTSRLGSLAAAAVGRAVRAVRLHPLVNQLPSCAVKTVWGCVERTCTVPMVLSSLQIRHVTSVAEVLRLLEPLPHSRLAQASGITSLTNAIPNRAQRPRSSSLVEAVRVLAGSHGRALVVLDSVAAAVVAGQWDMQGVAQADATVTALSLRLRQAVMTHNWCIVVTNQVRAIPTTDRQRQCALAPIKRARSPTTFSAASASFSARTVVPALGFSWASAPHCRVLLRKSLSHGVRQLVLHHAPSHPPAQASYLITEHGIEDA
ncbi:RAD51-6 / Rad51/recA bacterial DNA recombination protein [Leishmania donovani]|uniref:Rad51/recA_bacterial_DNA_recombination_protein/Ka iC_putative/Pfam:PF08423/Pfam:PF00154/Pfam:PF06745 n=1 Tax=Leishmania donovani TaxID=5661 RepID=A0A6J8FIG7_LEIDO|nr:RAD51-6 / Rad51/recA bacterial DNA recombination protein [Leishmania donovani]VDZ46370.1 Rad51/recA_bacterial_DNA_recombination_protein/KaiC_putative/Pfam:PF08423/Pfam:PF00154/Pfam:PF06745 [Leishmania donovani]